jgi:hypothetical protein
MNYVPYLISSSAGLLEGETMSARGFVNAFTVDRRRERAGRADLQEFLQTCELRTNCTNRRQKAAEKLQNEIPIAMGFWYTLELRKPLKRYRALAGLTGDVG